MPKVINLDDIIEEIEEQEKCQEMYYDLYCIPECYHEEEEFPE